MCLTTMLFVWKPTKNSDRFDCSFVNLIPPPSLCLLIVERAFMA